jgi:hypothetical protein
MDLSNVTKLLRGLAAWALMVILAIAFFVMLALAGCQQPTPVKPKPAPAVAPAQPAEYSVLVGEQPPPDGLPGHTGYVPQPDKTQEFLEELDKPFLRDAGPELFDARGPPEAKQGVLLYRAFQKAYKETYGREWIVGAQGIGDCVSWGWHHGVGIATAVEWQLGNVGEWKLPATEGIYGAARVEGLGLDGSGKRAIGGYSDGAFGGGAAKGVTKIGVLFRQPYEKFDLSKYSPSRAKEWGAYGCGGKGDGGWADGIAHEHVVKKVALVRTFDEAAAAIDSGYPVPVCSSQGFGTKFNQPPRDKDGFLRPLGSWGHCMCFIGTRYDRDGLLCLNSWGPRWVSGPKWPDDQPDGSFWVDRKTAEWMLSGRDSFAVSTVEGFPKRKLDNGDWVALPPRREHSPAIGTDSPSYALAP